MAGGRVPGPLNQKADPIVIDDGTLNRMPSFAPGPLGDGAQLGARTRRGVTRRGPQIVGGLVIVDWANYHPDWAAVLGRVRTRFPELEEYLRLFSARDLERGATRVFRSETAGGVLREWEIRLNIVSDRTAANGGSTPAAPVNSTRGGTQVVTYNVLVNSCPPGVGNVFPNLQPQSRAQINSRPQALQERLDDLIAEAVAHEFGHVLLLDQRAGSRSPVAQDYQRLLRAADSPGPRQAYQRVAGLAAAIIRRLALGLPIQAAVVETIVANHTGNRIRDLLLNELFSNQHASAGFGAPLSVQTIAQRYAAGRVNLMWDDVRAGATPRRPGEPAREPPRTRISSGTS